MMRLLRRSAPTARRDRERSNRAVWQAASLLLAYPDDGHRARLDTVDRLLGYLPEAEAEPLAALSRDLRATPVLDAATTYVETFDMRRRATLYLSYWTAGDTRNRGAVMLNFIRVYRESGTTPPPDESADHLAVVLEFAATVDPEAGGALLAANRPALDLLHQRLVETGSQYAAVLGAVTATLPPAGDLERQKALELARNGPPVESVGLQPFTLTVPPRRDTDTATRGAH